MDRPYKLIISDSSSSTANIVLKVNLEKLSHDKKSMNISDSQLGDFIFKELKLPHEDVLQLGFSTGRYDSREILVKYSTDLTNIITDNRVPPYHSYKDHRITITTLDDKSTKIKFINVPLSVPNEEIRHLCRAYGKLTDGTVHIEPVKLDGQTKVTLPGATRWIEVQLDQGKKLRNYYWLMGPGQGDSGRQVTVLHSNQGPRQCGHCLKPAAPPASPDPTHSSFCQGGGNGKTCKSLGTDRTKMSVYIGELKSEGYTSL